MGISSLYTPQMLLHNVPATLLVSLSSWQQPLSICVGGTSHAGVWSSTVFPLPVVFFLLSVFICQCTFLSVCLEGPSVLCMLPSPSLFPSLSMLDFGWKPLHILISVASPLVASLLFQLGISRHTRADILSLQDLTYFVDVFGWGWLPCDKSWWGESVSKCLGHSQHSVWCYPWWLFYYWIICFHISSCCDEWCRLCSLLQSIQAVTRVVFLVLESLPTPLLYSSLCFDPLVLFLMPLWVTLIFSLVSMMPERSFHVAEKHATGR